MKLVELNKKEFEEFTKTSEENNVYQTRSWGIFEKSNGWHTYYVGLDDKGRIKAASLILSKEVPLIKKRIFYCPRGYIINYKDIELLKIFNKEITIFAQGKNAIYIKIDPYVMYKQRDINGQVIENGIDNSKVVENLKQLGYNHFGFNTGLETEKPRWMYMLKLENKNLEDIMKEMDSKTRQIIRKNERKGIHVRDLLKDELPLFKEIMRQSNARRHLEDKPLSYYENMWNALNSEDILKVKIAYIDFDEYLENTIKERDKYERELADRTDKKTSNSLKVNEEKYEQKQNDDKNEIDRLNKEIEEIKKYQYEYGHRVNLGAILLLTYGNEVLALFDGTIEKFRNFKSSYTLHHEGIKYALEHGYKRYNFNTITGNFSQDNPLYGIYQFKRGFGGEVVELVGEFELIIDKFGYSLYKNVYPFYEKFKTKTKKNTKNKLVKENRFIKKSI